MPNQLKITYVRSAIGRAYVQKRTIKALGFSKLQQSRVVDDTPSMRGMINKVIHMLAVEEIEVKRAKKKSKKTTTTTKEPSDA